ncbi:polysaccharide deacetylase family protein [Microbacterium sp. SD291]|uniref:polysaccharide deacetylase family protein n=1 Tax=Microbacterium sp. SD291 TaxID=2782007 RepID=UPI001A96E72C|nr:polysaccharide deacetylase family protein [Microbacterium sp. SD291]MBO0981062.1 polysaccharide deacetylase family protein [Microbacterium sp. SD291]
MASGGKRRRIGVALIVCGAVLLAGGAAAAFAWVNRVPADPLQREGFAALEHPLTPAQQLVADADDPLACAVTFVGEGAPEAPMLQRQDALYQMLPIPVQDGRVFGGWYATQADAAAFIVAARVNGADPVVCADQQVELFAGWKSPEENVAENAQIPILMYHQFTADPEGESGWLRGNYAYIGDFEAQMNHIATTGFYLPTWDELGAFIDGRLFLPAHSVIITDDDADQTWFDLAVPVVEKHGVLTTSFMVTAYRQDPPPSIYVLRRSHTHDMHQAGDDGKGRMVNWTAEQIAADLSASAGVLGVSEVIAYPFGHHNDTAKQGVTQAGFEMARTIEPGYVEIGTDKLALPVVRIDYGMGLDSLIRRIG